MVFVYALDLVAPSVTEELAKLTQNKLPMIILLLVILFVMAGVLVNLFIFKKNKPAELPAEESSGEENEQ